MSVSDATYRALGQNSLRRNGTKISMPIWDGRETIREFSSEAEAEAFLDGARYVCGVVADWEDRWPRKSGGTS